jgi:hypothetical protein
LKTEIIQILDEKATGAQDPFSVEFACFKGNQEYTSEQQLKESMTTVPRKYFVQRLNEVALINTSLLATENSKELLGRSNTNTNLKGSSAGAGFVGGDRATRHPIRLFENVFELQGPKLAGLLRTVRCSPLLNSLFTVFLHHRMKHAVVSHFF